MRFLSRAHRNFTIVGSVRRPARYPKTGEIVVMDADPADGHPHPYPMRVIEERLYDGEKGRFPMVVLRPPYLDDNPYETCDDDEDVGWRSPPTLFYLPEDYAVGSSSGDLLPTRETLALWDREDTKREIEAFSREGYCPACGRPVTVDSGTTYDVNLINYSIPTVSFHKTAPCSQTNARYRHALEILEREIKVALTDLASLDVEGQDR